MNNRGGREDINWLREIDDHFPSMGEGRSFSGTIVLKSIQFNVLDIYVYRTTDNLIEIRFELLSTATGQEHLLPLKLHEPFLKCEHDHAYFYGEDKTFRILEESLLFTDPKNIALTSSDLLVNTIQDGKSQELHQSTISYQLSPIPHITLNWLGCFSYYLNQTLKKLNCLHYKNGSNNLPFIIGESDEKLSMQEYIKADNVKQDVTLKLLQILLSLKCEEIATLNIKDPYADLMESLHKITHAYRNGRKYNVRFVDYLAIDQRCKILSEPLINKIFDIDLNPQKKEEILLKVGRELIARNQKSEFSFLLKSLNYIAKVKLFSPCIGKKAPDGGKYNDTYTELTFLKHAEFSFQNRKICIINLDKNYGYQEWYAKGKRNHDIFISEMKDLAKVLDLEFEADCNFHSKLTFTKESTDKLIMRGFHLAEQCIKKLMYSQNFWSSFHRSEDGKQIITPLPIDVLNIICDERETTRTSLRVNK